MLRTANRYASQAVLVRMVFTSRTNMLSGIRYSKGRMHESIVKSDSIDKEAKVKNKTPVLASLTKSRAYKQSRVDRAGCSKRPIKRMSRNRKRGTSTKRILVFTPILDFMSLYRI